MSCAYDSFLKKEDKNRYFIVRVFISDSFNDYKMRQYCPIDCDVTSYDTERSDTRFLHNPPKGIERTMVKAKLQNKNLTSSRILELSEELNNTELDLYIE